MVIAKHWSIDDIPWHRFDGEKVDPEILAMVKAAALVEANSHEYVAYLHGVFADDQAFCDAASRWGEEEVQHGEALGRWAELADPDFSFADSFRAFRANYQIPIDATASVRGGRVAELIARCVVECATSSFYSAIRDQTEEPVLKQLCHRIAGDEFRHYKLFYESYRRYRADQPLGTLRRLAVAFGRISESSDDELAQAWYCGNRPAEPYDRKRHAAAYALGVGRIYRFGHVARGLRMALKACDVNPQGWPAQWLIRLAWRLLQVRTRRLQRLAA